MMHRLVGSVVLSGMVLLGAAACSGQGNDSSASSHGSSGAGGNDGGGAGGGGGVCQEANEVFGFKLTTSDGVPHACSELMDGDVTLEGVITASMPPSSYTIDSCQPGGGCSPMLNTLEVNSSALTLAIPVGTVVSGPVMSGTTVTWDVPSSPAKGRYAVRNVRANSGYCEIPGTVEYFIARDPAP